MESIRQQLSTDGIPEETSELLLEQMHQLSISVGLEVVDQLVSGKED